MQDQRRRNSRLEQLLSEKNADIICDQGAQFGTQLKYRNDLFLKFKINEIKAL